MIKHTTDVTVAALTQWMLANQDDYGCREAADTLGEMDAIPVLLEMLDGPLTACCVAAIASALRMHGDERHLAHIYRLRHEYGIIAGILTHAIENIEEIEGEYTCGQDEDDAEYEDAMGGTIRPVQPPNDPHMRN